MRTARLLRRIRHGQRAMAADGRRPESTETADPSHEHLEARVSAVLADVDDLRALLQALQAQLDHSAEATTRAIDGLSERLLALEDQVPRRDMLGETLSS